MDEDTTLELVFQLSLGVKYLFTKVSPLVVDRNDNGTLTDVYEHLREELGLRFGEEYSLLPVAVCHVPLSSVELSQPPLAGGPSCRKVPLVAEPIWRNLLKTYCRPVVKVIVENRRTLNMSLPLCNSSFVVKKSKELKRIDVVHFIPRMLKRSNIVKICEKLVKEDYSIPPRLRRGLWMHLLGVFHPRMETHDQRANFMQKLRRIYYDLKMKLGDHSQWSSEVQQLYQNIRCDAVRTDPGEKFLAEDPEKLGILERVTLIYALEHREVKYTQGMTDLLSPILYVMEREEDAYICLSALFGRIKENFDEWCKGTLNRMERLRHLCEVLDPELFHYLKNHLSDDPFVLFFGMILVQCRREFTFAESLHLFEVLCAASFYRKPDVNDISACEWAQFMTSESPEMIDQVFGGELSPYSVRPLGNSLSHDATFPRENVHVLIPPADNLNGVTRVSPLMEEHATMSLTSRSRSSFSAPCHSTLGDAYQGSSRNSAPEVGNNAGNSRHPTEMSDMSSVSSSNTANGNGQANSKNLPHRLIPVATPSSKLSACENGVSAVPGSEPTSQEVNVQTEGSEKTAVPKLSAVLRNATHSTSSEDVFALENGVPPNQTHVNHNDCLGAGNDDPQCDSDSEKDEEPSSSPVIYKSQHPQPSSSLSECSALLSRRDGWDLHSRCEHFPYSALPRRNGAYSSLPVLDLERPPVHPGYHFPISFSPGWSPSLPFQGVMNQLSGSGGRSLEVSLEVSQVLSSQAFMPDMATRETSLSVHMADAFSLFICLAILVSKRKCILQNRVDFVNLSMLLNARENGHNLDRILPLARYLCQMYSDLQSKYFGERTPLPREKWLDDDMSDLSESPSAETPPIEIPVIFHSESESSDLSSDS